MHIVESYNLFFLWISRFRRKHESKKVLSQSVSILMQRIICADCIHLCRSLSIFACKGIDHALSYTCKCIWKSIWKRIWKSIFMKNFSAVNSILLKLIWLVCWVFDFFLAFLFNKSVSKIKYNLQSLNQEINLYYLSSG